MSTPFSYFLKYMFFIFFLQNCWHYARLLVSFFLVGNKLIRRMRKCRNWQTSKTKDLVTIAVVWVQVPSSALFNLVRKPYNQGFRAFFVFKLFEHPWTRSHPAFCHWLPLRRQILYLPAVPLQKCNSCFCIPHNFISITFYRPRLIMYILFYFLTLNMYYFFRKIFFFQRNKFSNT